MIDSTILLPRESFRAAEQTLTRRARRPAESPSPESRQLAEEAEARLLEFVAERAKFDKRVELWGGDGTVKPEPRPTTVVPFTPPRPPEVVEAPEGDRVS